MSGHNVLHQELEQQPAKDALTRLLLAQRRQLPPAVSSHREALRRRLMARLKGDSPVAAGEIGAVVIDTALGFVGLALSSTGVNRVILPRSSRAEVINALRQAYPNTVLLNPADLPDYAGKLRRYARGELVTFDYTFDLRGLTEFQQSVLTTIRSIPYGGVWTYKEVAAAIGRPKATRAVGNALGKNPVPLMIPCHRVVGSGGKLGGYSGPGGVGTKKRLLALEQAWAG